VREKTTTSDSLGGKKGAKNREETTLVQKHEPMWGGLSKPQDL